MIAANTYRNNDAYLEAWVTHAQSLKPEARDARPHAVLRRAAYTTSSRIFANFSNVGGEHHVERVTIGSQPL